MEKYQLGKKIGNGSYGVVFKVTHNLSNMVYALKRLKKNKATLISDYPNFAREMESMERLGHPNVVSLIDHFESNNMVCLVMDYCAKGDLSNYISNLETELSTSEKLSLFRQVLEGIYHIHKNGYMHRDLKPDNILLTADLTVKIGDMGLTKKEENDINNTSAGTPLYASPQVMEKKGQYSKKCDVFSLGLILYFILFKKPFFEDATDEDQLIKLQSQLQLPQLTKFVNNLNCEEIFKDILKKCLCYSEGDRISIRELRDDLNKRVGLSSGDSSEVVPSLRRIEGLFVDVFKKTSSLEDIHCILSQLEIKGCFKLKTVKRYVLIYLLGCHMIRQLSGIKGQLDSSVILIPECHLLRADWVQQLHSKIEEYTLMCLRAARRIEDIKSDSYLTQIPHVLQDCLRFLKDKKVQEKCYVDIIQSLIRKQQQGDKAMTQQKSRFLKEFYSLF